jgi:hypothetical protein
MNLHTSKWASTLGIGVLTDLQIFIKQLQGQNPLDGNIPYIIGKILECRCLKWARMTHLNTQNTSYGQKKDYESYTNYTNFHLHLICIYLSHSQIYNLYNALKQIAYFFGMLIHWTHLIKFSYS